MTLRIGGLCAGYSGLEMGIRAVWPDSEVAWVSEIDKGACKILAHRFPGAPNIGDMTTVDWAAVELVDLICGGTPCQDLSHAGKRAGMTEGSRSNLWVAMREAIATIRPSTVIWENVGGAYSAAADSEMERDPRLLGVRPTGPVLRALGRVLGDLASLGYDASWHGLRAADVGAPHGRFRVFVVARDSDQPGLEGRVLGGERAGERAAGAAGGEPALLPSPRTSDTNGAGRHGDGGMDLRTAVTLLPTPDVSSGQRSIKSHAKGDHQVSFQDISHLLPTPAVNDMGEGKTPAAWDEWTERMKAAHGNGNGHGASLSIEAQRLLPTPQASDPGFRSEESATKRAQSYTSGDLAGTLLWEDWGQYAAAIHRWETLTRPAPPPTETGPKGNPRLSAAFSEWMMGLPAGWVAGVPGITRNEALRAIGNGVCPQQCAEALRVMAAWEVAA